MPDGSTLMAKEAANRMTTRDTLVLGVITGAHGVRGLVRVKSFTAVPEDLLAYGAVHDDATGRPVDLTVKGTVKGQLLASVDGVSDRNAAEMLKGTELSIARHQLPPASASDSGDQDADDFYVADLIGLTVHDATSQTIGAIVSVHDFGGGDVLEIAPDGVKPGAKETFYVPFTRDAVPIVEVAAGFIEIADLDEIMAQADREGGSDD